MIENGNLPKILRVKEAHLVPETPWIGTLDQSCSRGQGGGHWVGAKWVVGWVAGQEAGGLTSRPCECASWWWDWAAAARHWDCGCCGGTPAAWRSAASRASLARPWLSSSCLLSAFYVLRSLFFPFLLSSSPFSSVSRSGLRVYIYMLGYVCGWVDGSQVCRVQGHGGVSQPANCVALIPPLPSSLPSTSRPRF